MQVCFIDKEKSRKYNEIVCTTEKIQVFGKEFMDTRNRTTAYTKSSVMQAESVAMEQLGIPQMLLMEHAATAVSEEIRNITEPCRVKVLAGTGNNGADAVAAGRLLAGYGYCVSIEIVGDGRRTEAMKEQIRIAGAYPEIRLSETVMNRQDEPYDILIDGLFGIGLNREIQGLYREQIEMLNEYRSRHPETKVISVDIPSGIDATTGEVLGTAVRADYTVTFSKTKTGLVLYPGRTYAGICITRPIGIPESAWDKETGYPVLTGLQMLPKRPADGHKGVFGRTLLIAGSDGMTGASVLAAKACYRCGAGICKAVGTEQVLRDLTAIVPEALSMTRQAFLDNPEEAGKGFETVVIGPGLGLTEESEKMVETVLRYNDKTIIWDADALTILAASLTSETPTERIAELSRKLPANSILTPHIGELGRLLGQPTKELSGHTWQTAELWNGVSQITLIMKDACTLIVGDGTIYLNQTGNDGMGTAGSGDVLAGICGALGKTVTEGTMTAAEAAAAAVSIHGTAGDRMAEKLGTRSLMSGDIAEGIPETLKTLTDEKGLE